MASVRYSKRLEPCCTQISPTPVSQRLRPRMSHFRVPFDWPEGGVVQIFLANLLLVRGTPGPEL